MRIEYKMMAPFKLNYYIQIYFHKDKYPLQNEHLKCVVLTKEKGIGFEMRTVFGLLVGLGTGARVVTFLVVSEPRFRRFYKMIFEIVYDMHCICI